MKLIILKFQDGTELGLLPEIVGSDALDEISFPNYKDIQSSESNILNTLKEDWKFQYTGYLKDNLLNLRRAPIEWYLQQDPEISIQEVDLENYK